MHADLRHDILTEKFRFQKFSQLRFIHILNCTYFETEKADASFGKWKLGVQRTDSGSSAKKWVTNK